MGVPVDALFFFNRCTPSAGHNMKDTTMTNIQTQRDAAATTAFFQGLRDLDGQCRSRGVNKHDRAIVLIIACIEEGLNTGPRIVGALRKLGFNPRHVGMHLREGTGGDPQRHRWQRVEDGRYFLHEEATLA